jgi:hypothetical protein
MEHHLSNPTRRFLRGVATAAVAAAAGLALAGFTGGPGHADGHDHATAVGASKRVSGKELRLHDEMRKLWEDHIVWTRMAIVSFAADGPDLQPTLDRLLRNQDDIGNAFSRFYGDKAGNRLTTLLKEHINGAVDVLVAAKSGDEQSFSQAKDAWYKNGRKIADFLHRLNRHNWGPHEMRSMMRTHLDQTLEEASDRLAGNFGADIADYEAVHHHILLMADAITNGIIAQFPQKFR